MDDQSPVEQTSRSVPNTEIDTEAAIHDFKNLVLQLIRESWEQEEARAHFQALVEGMKKMVPELIIIGEAASFKVLHQSEKFIPWLITFDWMDNAKSFLLLWRDVLFQEQRAWLKMSNGEIRPARFIALQQTSHQLVAKAADSLFMDLDTSVPHPLNNLKKLNQWRLQNTPWPVYKEQLELLPEQSKKLLRQGETIWNASGVFVQIGSHFIETYDFWLKEISALKAGLKLLLEKTEQADSLDSTSIIEALEQMNEQWDNPKNSKIFRIALDDYISRLPKQEQIVADSDEGLLLNKEVNLRTEVRSWLESKLMSDIYELFMIQNDITNKIHLNMVSIQNFLLIDEEGVKISDKNSVIQVLNNFLKSLNRLEDQTLDMKNLTLKKIKKDFTISKIYSDDFLSSSLQYTISQYRDSARWKEVRTWAIKQKARFTQFQRNVLAEEALSLSERIVRVVKNRTPATNNSHYTNIFLTKGWIGDSFVVGREDELLRVSGLIENWNLGFRGAFLLTGQRFTGKTLFGELVSKRFFPEKSIKLTPNTKCILPGKAKRHIDLGADLNVALQFIGRYAKRERALIWIDDLEAWQNEEITLAENVSNLLKFIDSYSNRLFFVVSMSNWMKAQLSTAFGIDKVFQSEIQIGAMSTSDIQKAILIRHNATHTVLYDEKEVEITSSQLTKIIQKNSRISEGNIGETFQIWAYSVEKIDEEKIRILDKTRHRLPPFLSTDAGLLLRTIMMEKNSSEKHLRQLFGPAYQKTYAPILTRMINLGILKKAQNKTITINRYLSNEIAKSLSLEPGFTYTYQSITNKQVRL